MNPKVNTVLYALANGFKSVQVVNPHTVAIHLSHPVGALLDNISVFPAMIVNKKLVQQNPTAYYKNPVATGAFKVKSWVPGSHITLERNPYYWKKGKPYLDQIRFDYVPDDNARILRVKAGTAELAEAIPYSQIKSLSRQKKFKIETQQIGSWQGVFLNHRVHPYDDINVRKALNYATDKAAIDEAVYGGAAKIANDMLPSTSLTAPFSKVAPYSYNLTRAKQLMAASSVPNGFSATLIYPAGSTVHQELATVLQAEWAQIGVKVTVQAADGADAVKRFITPPGDYQMIIPFTQFTADVTAPDEIPSVYYAGGVAKTRTGWSPPQSLIDLVNQGSSTVNPKDRVKIWTAEQRAAMNQAPWVTLFFLPAVTAVSNQVHGFRTLPAAWWNLENVWLSK
jgi:peptide/nickel transport system substrate-binding protein